MYEEDRQINPFFSGREDLQTKIAEKSKVISRKHLDQSAGEPAGGMTQVIQGAPGIGKTSLLEKIKKNCIDQLNDDSTDFKTIPIYISNPDYLSVDFLRERIKDTLQELDRSITLEKSKQKASDTLKMFSSILPFGFGVGMHQSSQDRIFVPKKCTVLLLIDEVQSISPDSNPEVARMLRSLHGGSRCYPILPVLAGLSNSSMALEGAKIYRFGIGPVHFLQPLSLLEVKESIGKFMDYFHVQTNTNLTSEWGDRIGSWVDGWPMHVENTLAALGEELLITEGDLSAVDPHKIKLRATKRRVAYYNTRFGAFESFAKIVGEIMADIGSAPKDRVDIEVIIQKTLEKPLWAQVIPNSMRPKLNFEFLLRHGHVDRSPDDPAIFHCPIPSLQSFAVARTGSPLHVSAYAGDLESLGEDLNTGYEINSVDNWGRTPLHLAAEYDWDKAAKILLEKGADPQIRDNRKRLPLDMVKEESVSYKLINKVTNPSSSPQNSRDYDLDPSPGF